MVAAPHRLASHVSTAALCASAFFKIKAFRAFICVCSGWHRCREGGYKIVLSSVTSAGAGKVTRRPPLASGGLFHALSFTASVPANAGMLAMAACAPQRLRSGTCSASSAPSSPKSGCTGSFHTSDEVNWARGLEVVSGKTQAQAGAQLHVAVPAAPDDTAGVPGYGLTRDRIMAELWSVHARGRRVLQARSPKRRRARCRGK